MERSNEYLQKLRRRKRWEGKRREGKGKEGTHDGLVDGFLLSFLLVAWSENCLVKTEGSSILPF